MPPLIRVLPLLFASLVMCAPAQAAVGKTANPDVITQAAQAVAGTMNTVGWCYAGVKQALRSVGVTLWGGAAWEAKDQLLDDKRFHVVTGAQLRPGDIMVHGKSATHPYGHIAVYLGNGREASDHLQHVVLGGTYGATVVFRPNGKSTIKDKQAIAIRPYAVHTIGVSKKTSKQPVIASKPLQTHVASAPPVDPKAIAAADSQAKLYTYLYQQGAISRVQAEQKIAMAKTLHKQSGDAGTEVASN